MAKVKYLRIKDIQEQFGCSEHTVLHWIRTGELKAHNINRGKKRPQWRIHPDSLNSFLNLRSNQSPTNGQAPKRGGRRQQPKYTKLSDIQRQRGN